jgi:large subunit ribosomal protein L4
MKLEVLKIDGKKSGRSVDLSKDIFEIEPNDHAIYLAVK